MSYMHVGVLNPGFHELLCCVFGWGGGKEWSVSEFVTKMVEKEKGKGNVWLSSCRSETGIFFYSFIRIWTFSRDVSSKGGQRGGGGGGAKWMFYQETWGDNIRVSKIKLVSELGPKEGARSLVPKRVWTWKTWWIMVPDFGPRSHTTGRPPDHHPRHWGPTMLKWPWAAAMLRRADLTRCMYWTPPLTSESWYV